MKKDNTNSAADEGELLIGVGGAVVHIELHGDAVGGDTSPFLCASVETNVPSF